MAMIAPNTKTDARVPFNPELSSLIFGLFFSSGEGIFFTPFRYVMA